MLQEAYPDKYYQQKKQGFSDLNYEIEDNASLYYMTGKNLYLNELEAEDMMSFVQRGNTVFLSVRNIDTTLLEKIGITQMSVPLYYEAAPFQYADTKVRLSSSEFDGVDTSFSYFYFPFLNSFFKTEAPHVRVLGYNNFGAPNFLVYYTGKGKLYLHGDPRALSNYFLLHDNNATYFKQVLALLPAKPEHIYIDDYYSRQTYKPAQRKSSLFGFIFDNPPLLWAFLILSGSFLLYIFMNGKRRQRIIPIKKPVTNATVSFTEAIAGIYRKNKDNKNIAEKMITYFYEDIRTRYFISTAKLDQDFMETLSRKTGNSLAATKDLFYIMKMIQDLDEVSDEILMDLNHKLQNYKQA